MSIVIDNWSITSHDDPYTPPEARTIRLHGDVKNHPRFGDGVTVTTSPVVQAKGRVVRTKSGSRYRLGTIEPGYRNWLKKNRPNWDPKNPITIIGEE